VEDEILVSLDGEQRETLYQLLQITATASSPHCAPAADELGCR
jgi:hypothetical protein